MAYLIQSGYKVSAMTFQEEATPELEKTPLEGETLHAYFRCSQEAICKANVKELSLFQPKSLFQATINELTSKGSGSSLTKEASLVSNRLLVLF